MENMGIDNPKKDQQPQEVFISSLLLGRFHPAPLSRSPGVKAEWTSTAPTLLQTKPSEALTRQLGRGRNGST